MGSALARERSRSELVPFVEAFERAATASGEPRRWLAVGPRLVELCFAGPALLARFEPAWPHLLRPPGDADLTVRVFDSASTGVALPARPQGLPYVFQRGAGVLTVLDADAGEAVVWVEDAGALAWNEVAAPLRMLWHLLFAADGTHVTHAAAVGDEDGGVLIAGGSGKGKSTTALACLAAGLGYAGDDYVLLTTAPARAWSLYASAKLNPDQLGHFPQLVPLVANAAVAGDKPVLFPGRCWPERLRASLPLRAIVLPEVVGGATTRAILARPAAALRALAPSTIFQLPGAGAGTLRTLGRLVAELPAYTLELGAVGSVAPAVAELLDRLRRGA